MDVNRGPRAHRRAARRVRGRAGGAGRGADGQHGSRPPRRDGSLRRAVASDYLRAIGARVDVIDTGGFPMVRGAGDARSVVPDGDHLQPPRRAAGRRGRVAHAAVHVHPRRRSLVRARLHRRQGAGADGALRRAPGAGRGRARQHPVPVGAGRGDRQPELRAGLAAAIAGDAGRGAGLHHRLGGGVRHDLDRRGPAVDPLRLARADGVHRGAADRRQGRALGDDRRRRAQPDRRAGRAASPSATTRAPGA